MSTIVRNEQGVAVESAACVGCGQLDTNGFLRCYNCTVKKLGNKLGHYALEKVLDARLLMMSVARAVALPTARDEVDKAVRALEVIVQQVGHSTNKT